MKTATISKPATRDVAMPDDGFAPDRQAMPRATGYASAGVGSWLGMVNGRRVTGTAGRASSGSRPFGNRNRTRSFRTGIASGTRMLGNGNGLGVSGTAGQASSGAQRQVRGGRAGRGSQRRGVLLLIVLAMLSLFLLIGMTMVMISGQARRAARAAAEAERQQAHSFEAELDQAFGQIVHGTNNRASVLRTHSLLEDLYGNDGFPATVAAINVTGTPGNSPANDPWFPSTLSASSNGYIGAWPLTQTGPTSPLPAPQVLELSEFVCLTFNEFGADLYPGAWNVNDEGTSGTLDINAAGTGPDGLEFGWPNTDDTLTGFDGRPGVAGYDDDGDGVVDDAGQWTGAMAGGEVGAPGSDDYRISVIQNYYAGRYLTMVDGLSEGQTTMIVASIPRLQRPTTVANEQLIPSYGVPIPTALNRVPVPAVTLVIRRLSGDASHQPQPGDRFIVNGRPFNGTGFGLSTAQLGAYSNVTPQPPDTTPFVLGAYDVDGPRPVVTLPDGSNSASEVSTVLNLPSNVPPFAGAFDGGDEWNTATWPYALLPNPAAFRPAPYAIAPLNYGPYVDPAGPGGADEGYDAPDYQNMLLAMQRWLPDPLETQAGLGLFYSARKYDNPIVEMPSLHRPELAAYWYARMYRDLLTRPTDFGVPALSNDQMAGLLLRADNRNLLPISTGVPLSAPDHKLRRTIIRLKKKFLLRPLMEDHPNFTGSNPVFMSTPAYPDLGPSAGNVAKIDSFNFVRDAWEVSGVGTGNTGINRTAPFSPQQNINPRWDVDNDGDGIPDSIWVDLGAPPQVSPQGDLYRPLFAILCVDMDGKLNLNAHDAPGKPIGLVQMPAPYAGARLSAPTTFQPDVFAGTGASGWGPADINLGGVLGVYGYDGRLNTLDDTRSMGFDGRPGIANFDDDGNGLIDDLNEVSAGLLGDDRFVGGAGNLAGIPGVDDDRNGVVDDLSELGWLGSDDNFELARILRGWVDSSDPNSRVEGRYGELWRRTPSPYPLSGQFSYPPSPGAANLGNLLDTVNGWLQSRPLAMNGPNTAMLTAFPVGGWNNYELSDVFTNPDMPYFFFPTDDLGVGGLNVDDDVDTQADKFSFGATSTYFYPDWKEAGWPNVAGNPLNDDGTRKWRGGTVSQFRTPMSTYMSPPDLDGDGFRMLDLRGQPLLLGPSRVSGAGEPAERWDDPYELDLIRKVVASTPDLDATNPSVYTRDNPFAPTELEPLLRAYDRDAYALPSRLSLLAPALVVTPRLRHLVTTDSFDLPTPSLVVSPDLLTDADFVTAGNQPLYLTATGFTANAPELRNGSLHFSDLVRARVFGNFSTAGNGLNGLTGAGNQADQEWGVNRLLRHYGHELSAGQKLNLNVPLGNGVDDPVFNSTSAMLEYNGVVDEPAEARRGFNNLDDDGDTLIDEADEAETLWSNELGTANAVPMDHNRDGRINEVNSDGTGTVINYLNDDDAYARQQLAKQLYLLMMTLKPAGATVNIDADATPTNPNSNDARETARWVAQWAINIVDYRDADSIMTPFEYDVYPFVDNSAVADGDPWDVDGKLGGHSHPGVDGRYGTPAGAVDDSIVTGPGVDGIWGTVDDAGSYSDDAAGIAVAEWRGLVWGCERPELLITETLAFHDRRAVDGSTGVGKIADGDTNLDQEGLLPKGTLIVELYNPWSSPTARPDFDPTSLSTSHGMTEAPPAELYDDALQGVWLNRTAPGGAPVWRMVVTPASTAANRDGDLRVLDDPDLANLPAAPLYPSPKRFRFIYFATPAAPPGGYGETSISGVGNFIRYFPTAASGNLAVNVLPPRRYALVAPKNPDPTTPPVDAVFGPESTTMNAADKRMVPVGWYDSVGLSYALQLNFDPTLPPTGANATLTMTDNSAGTPPRLPWNVAPPGAGPPVVWTGQVKQPAVVMIDGSNVTQGSPTTGQPARMSVSEPIGGYAPSTWTGMDWPADIPFDDAASTLIDPDLLTAVSGLGTNDEGDVANFKLILLQRLANPLEPWDATLNPYLTIDSQSVGLTVFNSRLATAPTASATFVNTNFDSTQRGVVNDLNIWSQKSTNFAGQSNAINSVPGRPLLKSTLGYANFTYTPEQTDPGQATATNYGATGLNYRPRYTDYNGAANYRPFEAGAMTDTLANIPASEYLGDPINAATGTVTPLPVATFDWPNRPFVSAYELLQVPALSSSRLLAEPVASGGTRPGRGYSRSFEGGASPLRDYNPPSFSTSTFGHEQNLFESSNGVANSVNSSGTASALQFHRLLDFVHVPSRFVGTRMPLDPGSAQLNSGLAPRPYFQATYGARIGAQPVNLPADLMQGPFPFDAPHNLLSSLREPGKINLNTIFDPLVWRGLVNDLTGNGLTGGAGNGPGSIDSTVPASADAAWLNWPQFWRSRRGYEDGTERRGYLYSMSGDGAAGFGGHANVGDLLVPTTNDPTLLVVPMPTFFVNPFRPAGADSFVPLPELQMKNYVVPPAIREEVWAGLLRPVPQLPAAAAEAQPLLANNDTTNNARNTTHNPSFRYELLQKLGNTATNRSNVYAIWITVGYFKVEKAPREEYPWYTNEDYAQAFPDGLRLGEEQGLDEGRLERHKAFYLFDRSLPMAFERGKTHNTDNGILLRRIVE